MNNDTSSLASYVVSYAQNREDIILSAFFSESETGFYVDIGAHDPIVDSVTKYFYKRGWHGINVEPNKRLFEKLQKDRPRDINLNVAISNESGKLKLREYENQQGLSTASIDIMKSYESGADQGVMTGPFTDIVVDADTLKNIFTSQNIPKINFLKIDIEGFEYEALEGNDWKKYRPQVICIESNHITKDWHDLLEKNRYKRVFNDGLNEYFIDELDDTIKDKFRYTEMVIGRDIIAYEQYRQLQNLVHDVTTTRNSLEKVIQKNTKLKERIFLLEFALADSKRLKKQIKGLAHAIDNVIVVRINNLAKKNYAQAHFSYNKNSSAAELLELAYRVDSSTFAKQKSPAKRLFHKALLSSYKTSRKVAKKAAKKTFRLLKASKRMVKGKRK